MDLLLAAVVGGPAVVGGGLLVCGRVLDRVAGAVALVTAGLLLVGALVVAVPVLGGDAGPDLSWRYLAELPAALAVDGLSAVLLLVLAGVLVPVVLVAVGELDAAESRARFFGALLLFAGAMALTVTATTFPALLLGWEVMGATSWALISYWYDDARRVGAAQTAFLVTRGADLGLYLAAGAVLAGTGTLDLAAAPDATGGEAHVAAAGLLVAALGKSAQLPFSAWLSGAMQAPSPVSALLHSATMVAAGGYLLLRVEPLLAQTGWAATTAAWAGALTAVVLGAVACAQTDLKQLLAASTAAQLGVVVLAAGTGGVTAGTGHLVAHAAVKSLLFLAAGAWLASLGTRSLTGRGVRHDGLRGAARDHPVVGVTFTVAGLALAGLPPLPLWATKDAVLAGTREESALLYLVGLLGAVLAAAYAARAVALVWRPRRPTPLRALALDTERTGTRHVGPGERAALIALTVPAAVLGVLAVPNVADRLATALTAPGLTVPRGPTPRAWELALSATLALGAAAVAARLADRRLPVAVGIPLERWLGLRAVTTGLVVPVLALARGVAALDDRLLAPAPVGGGAGVRGLARGVARLDDGVVDGAVRALARGASALGGLARRSQTGQLHTYYAQALVVLGALLGVALLLLTLRP